MLLTLVFHSLLPASGTVRGISLVILFRRYKKPTLSLSKGPPGLKLFLLAVFFYITERAYYETNFIALFCHVNGGSPALA